MAMETDRQRVVAIIPARGGSKGVPNKNLRLLAGKPLVYWTIEAARRSSCVDRVVVSTDSPEIAHVSKQYGAEPIMRPRELAEDWSPSEDALVHALNVMGNVDQLEAVVFLQATSPLRTHVHIDEAFSLFRERQADSLLAVYQSHVFLWEEREGEAFPLYFDYLHRPMRQAMTGQFRENGALYIFKPSVLIEGGNRLGGKIVLYRMPEAVSLDIDNEMDIQLAELMLRRRLEEGCDY